MAHEPRLDQKTGQKTTGHEWDGIEELNTPLPRWWLWVFYVCIVWSVGYWVVYPAWPLVSSHTKGIWDYASRADVVREMDELKALRATKAVGLEAASLEQIKADPKLREIALAQGRAAFGDNCSACHGSGAQGSVGYPNLNDDDWLWGGTLNDIHTTLQYGIRSDHAQARVGNMPAFGKDGILKTAEIEQLADYVLSLSGAAPKDAKIDAGKALFADNCASCHGDDAKGNQELGAPSLADKIWLYEGSRKVISAQIYNSRNGVMPSWSGRLDPVTIKSLAVYVHSLGGGK